MYGYWGTEPVPEAAPDEPGRSRRRRTLHHEVIAVEKVHRVFRVGRHRLEAREPVEDSRGPFPAVADQVVDPPGAGTRRMRSDRHRIPLMEVEVAMHGIGRRLSPRVRSFGSLRGPVGRAVKLRLGRQPEAPPAGIRRRFVRWVNQTGQAGGSGRRWNIPRQYQRPPSRSQNRGWVRPEWRCRAQAASGPVRPHLVAPRLDELEEPGVRDVVDLDRERGNVDPMLRELVVPAERNFFDPRAERRPSRRHHHHLLRRRRQRIDPARRVASGAALLPRRRASATCRAASPGALPRAPGW